MSRKIDTGEAAFPMAGFDGHSTYCRPDYSYLTWLDLAAMYAMQGELAGPNSTRWDTTEGARNLARLSYLRAVGLLAEKRRLEAMEDDESEPPAREEP